MYSNFVQNISSLEWSALTGTTNYFILSKDSMIRLAELLGEDYELVSGTGEDHLLVVPGSTTGSLPGMDFHMICKKDNSNVGFYFITYNNSFIVNDVYALKIKDQKMYYMKQVNRREKMFILRMIVNTIRSLKIYLKEYIKMNRLINQYLNAKTYYLLNCTGLSVFHIKN